MNILESIYCYLHEENISNGASINYIPTNGNMIISLSISMLLLGFPFWILLIYPSFIDSLKSITNSLFNQNDNLFIILLSLSLLLLIYPIIKRTIGTRKNYESVLEFYMNSPKIEQQKIAKKGRDFFAFSCLFFGLPLFILSIIAAFS